MIYCITWRSILLLAPIYFPSNKHKSYKKSFISIQLNCKIQTPPCIKLLPAFLPVFQHLQSLWSSPDTRFILLCILNPFHIFLSSSGRVTWSIGWSMFINITSRLTICYGWMSLPEWWVRSSSRVAQIKFLGYLRIYFLFVELIAFAVFRVKISSAYPRTNSCS